MLIYSAVTSAVARILRETRWRAGVAITPFPLVVHFWWKLLERSLNRFVAWEKCHREQGGELGSGEIGN